MRLFYEVPTAVLDANRPRGTWHAMPLPDDATVTLLIVDSWLDYATQDAFEALPGVVEHPVWTWNDVAPAFLHRGAASKGIKQSHSKGQAMKLLRAHWKEIRP
jgi:hypothetical protein